MLPKRAAPFIFGFILSGVMTFCVTAIATWRAIQTGDSFVDLWLGSWVASWIVAFPLVLVFGPITQRLVARLVR